MQASDIHYDFKSRLYHFWTSIESNWWKNLKLNTTRAFILKFLLLWAIFQILLSENFIHNIALTQLAMIYWQIIAQVIDCIMTKRQQTQTSNPVTAFADSGCVWHPLSVSKDQWVMRMFSKVGHSTL